MTILPKKKVQKDKTDSEEAAPSPTGEGRVVVPHSSRRQGSPPPPRWNSPTPVDDRITIQDPGGRFEEPGTSKRRHRSSPHRTGRKHRHSERPAHHSTRQAWGEATQSASSSHTNAHRSFRTPATTSQERVEPVEEGGYNSGDEYVPAPPIPSSNSQNLEEVSFLISICPPQSRVFSVFAAFIFY